MCIRGVANLAASLRATGTRGFPHFRRSVSQHRPEDSGKEKMEPWVWVVVSASIGLLLVLLSNVVGCFTWPSSHNSHAAACVGPTLSRADGWGFLVPFVWASARNGCPYSLA